MKKGLIVTAVLLWLILVASAADTGQKLLGDVSDGSRAIPVHIIPLLNEEGEKISPQDSPLLPFSTRRTCGTCHSYNVIAKGWHFNAPDPNVSPGLRLSRGYLWTHSPPLRFPFPIAPGLEPSDQSSSA